MGCAQVQLVLAEAVVKQHSRFVRIQITHPVIGILACNLEFVPLADMLDPTSLHKEIPVPLSLRESPHVIYYGTRDPTVTVVIIYLGIPSSVISITKNGTLNTETAQVTILTHRSRIPRNSTRGKNTTVSELILAVSTRVICTQAGRYPFVPFLLPYYSRTDQPETATFQHSTDIIFFTLVKPGATSTYVYRTTGTEIPGRLENLRLLTIVKGYFLDILHRETPQVHKTVLRVSQLDSVIEDTHVIGSHAPHVNRLQTTYPAIVFDLHTAEITQSICHGMRAQRFQTFPAQPLAGNNLIPLPAVNSNLVHITVNNHRIPLLGKCQKRNS